MTKEPTNHRGVAPLTAAQLEAFEFDLHGSAARPDLWQEGKSVSDKNADSKNERLLLANILVRAKKWRDRHTEARDALDAEGLALLLGEPVKNVNSVLSKGRDHISWESMERAFAFLLLGSSRTSADPRAMQVYERMRNVFFGAFSSPARKGLPSSPYFAKAAKGIRRPVNYWEALTLYYKYRGLRAAHPDRRRVALTLVSGHQPFTAGEVGGVGDTGSSTNPQQREWARLVQAFRKAMIDCARAGCHVRIIVPDLSGLGLKESLDGSNRSIRSARSLQRSLREQAPDVLESGMVRFLAIDPRGHGKVPSGVRFAAEYLQGAFRYASFRADEHNEGEPTGWEILSQDVLVLRPLAESHLLLGSFDASADEAESFNEWLSVFETTASPLAPEAPVRNVPRGRASSKRA